MLKLLKIPWITESKRPASHTAIPTTLPQKDEYFQYTRGRFVCNEEQEMAQRYVHFNVAELGRIAAEATGSKSCIGIEKYYDGMYNKVFLLTMDDGVEVVAKLPNPNAGRPHYTIASEVATMDFVRILCLFRHMIALTVNRSGPSLAHQSREFLLGALGLKPVK
ncbi:MAG: hypothetical protein M1812_007687 [Candelaria pacifica]|nr:MAG: hypothetical protein M1812_007687 [Candelaria pacifica]